MKKFQTDNGLEVDGIIGTATIAALNKTEEKVEEKTETETKTETSTTATTTTQIVKLKEADVFAEPPVMTDVTGAFTIVEVNGEYGKLKSGAGWVKLPE